MNNKILSGVLTMVLSITFPLWIGPAMALALGIMVVSAAYTEMCEYLESN